jgi:hypothetical protein
MNIPQPPPLPQLRRRNAVVAEDDLAPRNLNLDFMNARAVDIPPAPVPHLERQNAAAAEDFEPHNLNLNARVLDNPNVVNVPNAANEINVNQLNDYFYNLFQFAKNEQRARGQETLSWDNYRNRFYNTFLVSEKEKIMSDMREEVRVRYDHVYPKFHGYGFGKKKSSKKSAKKVKKSAKKTKKSIKKTKKSVKKSVKKTKKSVKKVKKSKRSLKK